MIKIPAPLAEGAATAERTAGPCSVCRHPIRAGERFAVRVPDGRPAHLPCIAAAPS